ncbi:MAG: type VII secretion-associated serine protease mycosin, partial [Micromonosporaceae bacterium]
MGLRGARSVPRSPIAAARTLTSLGHVFARWRRLAAYVGVATACALLVAPAPAQADNVRDKQWHLNELRVRTAWHESTGKGVVVAVVDSGV